MTTTQSSTANSRRSRNSLSLVSDYALPYEKILDCFTEMRVQQTCCEATKNSQTFNARVRGLYRVLSKNPSYQCWNHTPYTQYFFHFFIYCCILRVSLHGLRRHLLSYFGRPMLQLSFFFRPPPPHPAVTWGCLVHRGEPECGKRK